MKYQKESSTKKKIVHQFDLIIPTLQIDDALVATYVHLILC